MENAYHPEAWREVYVMLGGAAAALTGLVFVAVSLHFEEMMGAPLVRLRAANITASLLSLLVFAAIILIPQNSSVLLGVELLVAHVVSTALIPVRFTIHIIRHKVKGSLPRMIRALLLCAVALLGDVSLIIGHGGGMYVVTTAYLALLCAYMANVWALFAGAFEREAMAKKEATEG